MSVERVLIVEPDEVVESFLRRGEIAANRSPRCVVVMGPPASGKSTWRRAQIPEGHVVVDAAEIFLAMVRNEVLPFPGEVEPWLEMVGRRIAVRAVAERRDILTEVIGASAERLDGAVAALRSAGYQVTIPYIHCDPEEAWRRNLSRGPNDISAYYAEPFNLRWLSEAAAEFARQNEASRNDDPFSQREWMVSHVRVLLKPSGINLDSLRSALRRARSKGHDPLAIYDEAVAGRPENWEPAPPWESVAPPPEPKSDSSSQFVARPKAGGPTMTRDEFLKFKQELGQAMVKAINQSELDQRAMDEERAISYVKTLLPPVGINPSGLGAALRRFQRQGLDPERIYEVATAGRLDGWERPPDLEDLLTKPS